MKPDETKVKQLSSTPPPHTAIYIYTLSQSQSRLDQLGLSPRHTSVYASFSSARERERLIDFLIEPAYTRQLSGFSLRLFFSSSSCSIVFPLCKLRGTFSAALQHFFAISSLPLVKRDDCFIMSSCFGYDDDPRYYRFENFLFTSGIYVVLVASRI